MLAGADGMLGWMRGCGRIGTTIIPKSINNYSLFIGDHFLTQTLGMYYD